MSDNVVKLIVAVALLVHGLGHGGALGALMWIGARPGTDTGGWLAARSWLVPSLPASTATTVASSFWILSLIGFRGDRSPVLGRPDTRPGMAAPGRRFGARLDRWRPPLLRHVADVQHTCSARRERRSACRGALAQLAAGDAVRTVMVPDAAADDDEAPVPHRVRSGTPRADRIPLRSAHADYCTRLSAVFPRARTDARANLPTAWRAAPPSCPTPAGCGVVICRTTDSGIHDTRIADFFRAWPQRVHIEAVRPPCGVRGPPSAR